MSKYEIATVNWFKHFDCVQNIGIQNKPCLDDYDIVLFNIGGNHYDNFLFSFWSDSLKNCSNKLVIMNLPSYVENNYYIYNEICYLGDIKNNVGKKVIHRSNYKSLGELNNFLMTSDFYLYQIAFSDFMDFTPCFFTRQNTVLGGYYQDENNNFYLFLPSVDGDVFNDNNLDAAFIEKIINIKKELDKKNDEVVIPDWVIENKEFQTKQEQLAHQEILTQKALQQEAELKIAYSQELISKENNLKYLLFADSTALELGVIEAMTILGFNNVKTIMNGADEIDIFSENENFTIIGEVKGAEKQVDKQKYNQLNTHADNYEKSKNIAEENIKRVLFGNAYKNENLKTRKDKSAFNDYIINACSIQDVSLINTVDLFFAVLHYKNTNDAEYKRKCWEAIANNKSGLVKFPFM